MTPPLHPYLAAAAAREVRVRETHYPAMIERGEIARDDAGADLAAWRAIATLFAEGSAETDLPWATLALAAARALQRCEDDLAAQPDNPRRRERRDTVWAIHERIVHDSRFWTGLGQPAPMATAKAA